MDSFSINPFGKAMMAQFQQAGNVVAAQTRLAKRTSALELTCIEGEITIARKQVDVVEAELKVLSSQLDQPNLSEAEVAYLRTQIALAGAEREARLEEVKARESYLESKKEMAEATLAADPNILNQFVGMLQNEGPDDPKA